MTVLDMDFREASVDYSISSSMYMTQAKLFLYAIQTSYRCEYNLWVIAKYALIGILFLMNVGMMKIVISEIKYHNQLNKTANLKASMTSINVLVNKSLSGSMK